MKTPLVLLLCAASLAAGCFRRETPWDPIHGEYSSGNWFGPRFSLTLPDDWMMLNNVEDGLVATRDGFNLQAIKVRRIDPGKPLPHTKKTVARAMRPNELAEVLLDDLRSDGSVLAMKVLESRPATVAGSPGFRAAVAFRDSYGLRVQAVVCGVLLEDHAWQIAYVAPARYYYKRDLATFDQAVASFRVR